MVPESSPKRSSLGSMVKSRVLLERVDFPGFLIDFLLANVYFAALKRVLRLLGGKTGKPYVFCTMV
jgi:hypothetical protein